MTATLRDPAFRSHAPQFEEVVGEAPTLALVVETDAHEGPAYFADENALYFTTRPERGADGAPAVQIKRVGLDQRLIGEIRLPGAVNFCFGGPERDLLFITTDAAVWVAELAAKGA